MAVLVVNGQDIGLIHRSVLDRVASIAARLERQNAVTLASLPASFDGTSLRRLRGDLDQVIAFADAARQTGWTLGSLAAAPADKAVPVLSTAHGMVWVHPARGFELHGKAGARRVTELAGWQGTARRAALTSLAAPLVEAVARARTLQVRAPAG
jgi:hypothetical protein